MPENQSNNEQEFLQFLSNLEIKLSVSGVPDAAAALREIQKIDSELLKDMSKLKDLFGGVDGALDALVNRYKQRAALSSKAAASELSPIKAIFWVTCSATGSLLLK